MAETNKPLSRFSITSFGGGGAEEYRVLRSSDANSVSKVIDLLNRIYALEAKMAELYMRPRMEHSDPAWVGYVLYFDPLINDKPATGRPRWWLAPGLTSDHKTTTEFGDTTGTRIDQENIKVINYQPYINKHIHEQKVISKFRYLAISITPSGGTTTITLSTTTITTTDVLSTTTTTSTTTPSTDFTEGTPETKIVDGTVIKKTRYHFTNDEWEETSVSTSTDWDEETPGTYTETDTGLFFAETELVTDTILTTTTETIDIGP